MGTQHQQLPENLRAGWLTRVEAAKRVRLTDLETTAVLLAIAELQTALGDGSDPRLSATLARAERKIRATQKAPAMREP